MKHYKVTVCKCGCGQSFEYDTYHTQLYITKAHKQRDYRVRQQARKMAWGYIAENNLQLFDFGSAYEYYYDWYRAISLRKAGLVESTEETERAS